MRGRNEGRKDGEEGEGDGGVARAGGHGEGQMEASGGARGLHFIGVKILRTSRRKYRHMIFHERQLSHWERLPCATSFSEKEAL